MSRRFALTILTLVVIGAAAIIAILLAKGYRYSPKTGTLSGTGIISASSIPDQASVFLDGHLTTATNANINSLPPQAYDVRITKDGFIPWDKRVKVRQGLVTQVKATLYPAIPTVYPLTFNGVKDVTLSEDGTRLAFIVPEDPTDPEASLSALTGEEKSGVWVWEMGISPLSFANGPEPHRIAALLPNEDYSQASLRWSPDSSQVLLNLPDRSLLLDENRLNDPERDITAILEPTVKQWNDTEAITRQARIQAIKNPAWQSEASNAAVLKWSPDQTKILYCVTGCQSKTAVLKVGDLLSGQTYTVGDGVYSWLPDSRHLAVVEPLSSESGTNRQPESSPSPQVNLTASFAMSMLSVLEYDGSNKDEIYVGNFDPESAFSWPDGSRMVIVSSVPTVTGNKPNLFGINLK